MLRVLVAEDDDVACSYILSLLTELRPQWCVCATVADAASALRAAAEHRPHLLLLDIHLTDEGQGRWFIPLLQEGMDVIFITGDPAFAVDAFEGNAVDYLLKPITRPRFEMALARFEARQAQRRSGDAIQLLEAELSAVKREAREDPLTGLANRRAFDERLAEEVQRAVRYHRPLSILALDLDHFKQLNDQGSHLLGDTVLRELARALHAAVRTHDLVARIGGDEFAIILPDTSEEGAQALAKQVGDRVTRIPWGDDVLAIQTPSVSVGWAALGDELNSPDEILLDLCRRADAQLYVAKSMRPIQDSSMPG